MNAVVKHQSKDQALASVVTDSGSLLAVIGRLASDPAANVENMERLMAMYERMQARNSEIAFNDALTEAQAKIGRIEADTENKQTHSWYASYAAMDRTVRPIYTDAGFSLSFNTTPSNTPEMVRMLCLVSHKGGHTREYGVDMPADGKGAKGGDVMTKTHAAGSAFSYGQRYLLKLIFNIAIGIDPDDDDGNAAAGRDAAADWYAKIEAATSHDELKAIADEVKTAKLDGRALRNVRASWAKRNKELAA